MDFTLLRFSNVYGVNDDNDRVINVFIRRTMQNDDLTVFGKDKILDFAYIDDCIRRYI